MTAEDLRDPTRKLYTRHREDVYMRIQENDQTGIFSTYANIFLAGFAIGFHFDMKESARGNGSKNHMNMDPIPVHHQKLIIALMTERHPNEFTDKDSLWTAVEDYAEYGVVRLCESLKRTDWVLDVQDVLSTSGDSKA